MQFYSSAADSIESKKRKLNSSEEWRSSRSDSNHNMYGANRNYRTGGVVSGATGYPPRDTYPNVNRTYAGIASAAPRPDLQHYIAPSRPVLDDDSIRIGRTTVDVCRTTYPLQHHHVTEGKVAARVIADQLTAGLSYKILQNILNNVALESAGWAVANPTTVDVAMAQQKISLMDVHTLYERLSPYVTYYGRLVSTIQLQVCVLKMKLALSNQTPSDLYDTSSYASSSATAAAAASNESTPGRSVSWYRGNPVDMHSFAEAAATTTPKLNSTYFYERANSCQNGSSSRIFPYKSKIKCELCQENVFMHGEPVAFISESSCTSLFHERCVLRNYRSQTKKISSRSGSRSGSSSDVDEEDEGGSSSSSSSSGIRSRERSVKKNENAQNESVTAGFCCPCSECKVHVSGPDGLSLSSKYFYYYTVPYDAMPLPSSESGSVNSGISEESHYHHFKEKKRHQHSNPPSVQDPAPDCEECLHKRGMKVPMILKKNGRTENMYYGCPYWHVYKCRPKYFNVNPFVSSAK